MQGAKALAEKATGAKSRFLAAASHDLRQPLQSLGLYISPMKRRPSDAEKVEVIAGKMSGALDTMGERLDALLDITKLESGAVTPEIEVVSSAQLIDRIVASCIAEPDAKRLTIVQAGGDFLIRSDRVLLRRILHNFLSNAIKYTSAMRYRLGVRSPRKGMR